MKPHEIVMTIDRLVNASPDIAERLSFQVSEDEWHDLWQWNRSHTDVQLSIDDLKSMSILGVEIRRASKTV